MGMKDCMVDPLSLLIDDLNSSESTSSDVGLHAKRSSLQTPEVVFEAGHLQNFPHSVPEARSSIRNRRCRSARAGMTDRKLSVQSDFIEDESHLSGRNWRGVDRPTDVSMSKPSTNAIR